MRINIMLVSTLLIIMIIGIAGCGSKKDGGEKSGQVAVEHVKVETPKMDIHAATFMGDIKVINQHIAAGSDIDIREPSVGSTPLISASVFGKSEAVKALIAGGADLNIQNNEGSTALLTAAFLGHLDIVKLLLEAGADKSLRNKAGSTAYESVDGPFEDVEAIYDIFRKDLGPLGLKLDYDELKDLRPKIAELLK